MFQSAEPYKIPPRSLATSLTLHALGIAILCWAGLPASPLRTHKFHAVLLAPAKEQRVKDPPVTRTRTLPEPALPEPSLPEPVAPARHAAFALPKPAPPVLAPPPPAPIPVLLPEPLPVVSQAILPHRDPEPINPPVKLGVFEPKAAPAHVTPPETPRVKSAEFDAVQASAATRTQRAAATGAFDAAFAAGSGSNGGNHSRVSGRTSGFGDTQTVEPEAPRLTVLAGNFGDAKVTGPERRVSSAAAPATIPVEILDKPRPAYTEEARRLKIQGEVLLEAAFEASGTVRVLGVIRGLGHGLDETATAAARQIRFRPAQCEGKPVDSTAVVHIIFQLAD